MARGGALALVLLSALLAPGLARAESVPGTTGAQDALLAVAPDGTPRVAFVAADNTIEVAARAADGTWNAQPVPGLPGGLVVGLDVTPAGAVVLLVESPGGAWLSLAEQQGASWLVRTVARPPAGGTLGFGGLALDAAGRAQIAYAYQLPSRKTWLRLVHETAQGTLVGEAVTKLGFPKSDVLPAAAPVVLASGAVRIVETYASGTIEWSRTKDGKDWSGQFVYAQTLGSPAGVVRALATPAGVWSAWTELFQNYGESQLLLTLHRNGETTAILSHHAFLTALTLGPGGAEVGANDYVDVSGRTVYAGLLADASGALTELEGDLVGFAVDAGGGRQALLAAADGSLAWYRAPAAPLAHVTLAAAFSGADVVLTGRVDNATQGAGVELWRETQTGPELVTTLPLAADGSFTFTDTPSARPLTYRAVYRDPVSLLPLASLVRTPLGG